jgi:hypothetical protein
MAATVRRVAPGLSLPADRVMLLQHAHQLETEAAALEAQADALECPSPSS